MTEGPEETSEALKRIKQLENQNIKFKNLLDAVLGLASQEAKGITNLQNESNSLKSKVEALEKEKSQLEEELNAVLEDSGSEIFEAVKKLEQENAELKTKFENVVNQIKKDNLDLDILKAEDAELKKILVDLEHEKAQLIEKIRKVGESITDVTDENLKKRLFEIESEKFNIISSLEEQPSNGVLPTCPSLDQTKNDAHALEEQNSIKEKLSELEQKNEELLKVVQKSDSSDIKAQIKINEEVITTNASFLNKVDQVRSKMEEMNNDFVKTLEAPKELTDHKISELEQAKSVLYKDLERCLLTSSSAISKLTQNISNPEIKRLVNEIEIQKTVLLFSLQSAKLNSNQLSDNQDNLHLPSVPTSASETDISNKLASLGSSQASENPSTSSKERKNVEPTTSKEEHQKLEEEVNRLEHERERLLEQLRSISASSTNGINDIVTQNERQLQTQSELHSTFMRESSHEVVITQNYDDATNQLYADEDARLEQRIRELEIENIRIQRELDTILEEIRADKSEMSRLQFTGQILRERIEELEHNNVPKK